jgi:hypothetical protein
MPSENVFMDTGPCRISAKRGVRQDATARKSSIVGPERCVATAMARFSGRCGGTASSNASFSAKVRIIAAEQGSGHASEGGCDW